MNRLDEFRIYYNHTIHPELLRLEKKRKRLLYWLFFSIFLLTGILILEFYVNIFLVTLFMAIPISLYIAFLIYQIQRFISTFKPNIVNLILEFISEGDFEYDAKGHISKKQFLSSKIFVTDAPYFKGEDFIKGKIGEINFEMSELYIREFSKVRSRLNYVFRGVMLIADFHHNYNGVAYILPEEFQQYLSRSIKQFTLEGAEPQFLSNPDFEEVFMVYANNNSYINQLLRPDVQKMLVDYRKKSGKEIYISFLDGKMYVAATEHKDILEPYLFQSNVSYKLVKDFYYDLQILFKLEIPLILKY